MAPGYRPPSTEPKGRWARHIHAYRRAQGWNQTRAFEEWHAGLGLAPKSRTAYRAIDLGEREPNAREAEYLAAQIGWPPETEETGPTATGEAGLADAIREQTKALSALLAWLQGHDERLATLEAAVALNRHDIEALAGGVGRREPRGGGAGGELAPQRA